ncbi:MAG: FadR/GntR family transcriptional regulator [Spirochaetes bacterium]|nr:FadR/GntR family transcriptional regulator [Spirochaetota bacterium]
MESPNWEVKRTNLYEQIADSLEKAILQSGAGVFAEGETIIEDKLPSEQTLAVKFGVSRTVIREALKLVKERGLIELRTGEGSYITKPRPDAISSVVSRMILMDNVSDDEIFSVRGILEIAACRLAAEHAESSDMERMQSLLDAMKEHWQEDDAIISMDTDFHIAIAKASKNKLLGMLVEAMTVLIREFIRKTIHTPGAKADGMMRHALIMDAIKSGDPNAAEVAIRNHLEVSRQNIAWYTLHYGSQRTDAEGAVPK